MYEQYKDRSAWYLIYIREAHPSDGWQVDANVEEGFEIEQPDTMDERMAIAKDFVTDTNISIPVLIDGIDNAVAKDYKSWPDRLYVVGKDGRIVFKGEQGPWGFEPMETIPAVFDTISGVDARNKLAVTWGTLKAL